MTAMTPPRWAEALLRIVLARRDRDTVSGDLLEEYRLHVVPARGRRAADRWYLRQVGGFLWRSQLGWAIALSVIFVGRTALDWLVPIAWPFPRSDSDFYLRSAVTTYSAMAVLMTAGAAAAWRSHSIVAGAIAGASVAIIAAAFDVAGAGLMLVLLNDRATLAAEQSGGISEVFILPIILIVPAAVLGLLGGVPFAVVQRLRRYVLS